MEIEFSCLIFYPCHIFQVLFLTFYFLDVFFWITDLDLWLGFLSIYSAYWRFPGGSDGKVSAYNADHVGDPGSIPGSGRSPGEGNGNPLQYSCLKIPRMEEPGRLKSMGSQRVRHDWATSLSFVDSGYVQLPLCVGQNSALLLFLNNFIEAWLT